MRRNVIVQFQADQSWVVGAERAYRKVYHWAADDVCIPFQMPFFNWILVSVKQMPTELRFRVKHGTYELLAAVNTHPLDSAVGLFHVLQPLVLDRIEAVRRVACVKDADVGTESTRHLATVDGQLVSSAKIRIKRQ